MRIKLTRIAFMLTVISFLPSPLGTAQTVRQQRSTTKNQKVSQLAAVESGCFKGVLNSVALEIPLLVYPADAARRGIGGKVTIKVFVNEMGMVYYASAVGGPRMLRKAALRSAQGSRFTPFTQHDQLIKCAGLLVYTFNPPGRLES